MSPFCAICTRTCNSFTREPIGKNDALVVVCSRCGTDPVVPADPQAARRGRATDEVAMDRVEWIKFHRAQLIASGRCMFGADHDKPIAGNKACEQCRSRDKARKAQRRAA